MDTSLIEKMLKLMASQNDVDAVMGLRGLEGIFTDAGTSLAAAVFYAVANIALVRDSGKTVIDHKAPARDAAPVAVSGMPQCRVPQPGHIEIIVSGKTAGQAVILPGASAEQAEAVAANLKDALVAAVINKSRLKLKLLDIKNKGGEIVETILQAEYDRPGMTPVRVWVNDVRGEVAALATVLRKAVANAMPELVAA